MAKCRSLIQENQELGMQMSQGRIGELESELALQKKFSDELKTTQTGLPLSLYADAYFMTKRLPSCSVVTGCFHTTL